MLTTILVAILALFALGILGAWRSRLGGDVLHYAVVSACATIAAHAALCLFAIGAPVQEYSLAIGLPWSALRFALDPLAAWFLLVVNVAAIGAAVYGIGYAAHLAEPARVAAFFPGFIGAMNLVVVSADAFGFIFAWEAMSVASWLLVLANDRRPETARAASLYLMVAVAGTGCLILAFGLLAGPGGDFSFAAMRANPPADWTQTIALALVVAGAGSKAGLVPLHVWLPLAHPAAPSHVSALMSGAMTKVALYGLVRFLFDLGGDLSWGWGAALILIGAASAFLGVLHALMEQDLKVLLAYSTVENVGVVTLALGLSLAFRASDLHPLAALAFVAALLHALNHALFKSLLFLGAGSVQAATGERDLDRLGGLIRRLPRTAVLFLVGSAAIAALPPLNGFVSEWLLFQAVLNGASLPQWVLKFEVPVAGALLALSAALAGACFVRAFGIVFLGRPRSDAPVRAREVAPSMVAAMMLLAAGCLAIGLVPTAAIALLNNVALAVLGTPFPAFADGIGAADWLFLSPLGLGQSSYSGVIVFAVTVSVTVAAMLGVRALASGRSRRAPAWDCGYPEPSPAAQYTASSFAQPIRRVFATVAFRARERVDMPEPGESRPARFEVTLVDPSWRAVFGPIERGVGLWADRMNALQFLTIRRNLVLMFLALVVLLSVVVLTK